MNIFKFFKSLNKGILRILILISIVVVTPLAIYLATNSCSDFIIYYLELVDYQEYYKGQLVYDNTYDYGFSQNKYLIRNLSTFKDPLKYLIPFTILFVGVFHLMYWGSIYFIIKTSRWIIDGFKTKKQ